MKKLALPLLLTALFTGCGTVGSFVVQDNVLRQRAAFTLNTTPEKVTISNKKGTLDSIYFSATTNGKTYQCYVGTLGGVLNSDAVCSGVNNGFPPSK
ncbi:hypothetical protein L292_2106 [Acinetobacter junii CIP 107470 = MTCC 11364]|uniref:Lipoprotein n=1 Tax=Acinetobacter junii CIP 107470 = MTCC 11364 TaxID=1217666 RepID=S7WXW4_ACIJU|nr:hypothetical protein [Acinetobacter junii]ENV52096.1 hypothetical protein F953_00508 [Acinetobacter junii CIP 107470 = MTCC 11364]EPR86872.1 hypothetical protein L292_2106 [Acinetobacter junii CIP 107470 = MTCC 11364]